MITRLVQTGLLLIVVAAAWVTWRDLPRGPVISLEDVAIGALRDIFGEAVTTKHFAIDLVEGVRIGNLRMPSDTERDANGDPIVALEARDVAIIHNVLALAAGHYEPVAFEINGASVVLRETADGFEPALEFDLAADEGGGPPVRWIRIRDADLYVRARPGSTRLAEDAVVIVRIDSLAGDPSIGGALEIDGRIRVLGVGQDEEVIRVTGRADPVSDGIDVHAEWTHLTLTEQLLDLLPRDTRQNLAQQSIKSGRLRLRVVSEGGADPIHFYPQFDADLEVDIRDIPGMEVFEATTADQLQELFGRGILALSVVDDVVNIESLVTQMAGGTVEASGTITPETGELSLRFKILDLELSDPAVRRALGEQGAEILEQFRPTGIVDAVGLVERDAEGNVTWQVDVELDGAAFEYVGEVNEETGEREGFPYRIYGARGRIRIRPEGVFFDDIRGYHKRADVLVRGHHRKAWTGGETGRILFTDEGADIRITIDAIDLAFDDDIRHAVRGSEFADVWDEFHVEGTLDHAEIDILSDPRLDDAAVVEFRLTLAGSQFRYLPFPLTVEDVIGTVIMRRPRLEQRGEHGNTYTIDVGGWVEGARVSVQGTIEDHTSTGLLEIHGERLPLAGAVTEVLTTSEVTKGELGEAWMWAEPRGLATVLLKLPLNEDPRPLEIFAALHGVSVRLDAAESPAPIEVDEIEALLVYDGRTLYTPEMATGRAAGAEIRFRGQLDIDHDEWSVSLETDTLRLDPKLVEGLDDLEGEGPLLPLGLTVDSGSQLSLNLQLFRSPDDTKDVDLIRLVDLNMHLIKPGIPPVHLEGRRIDITDDAVELEEIVVRAPGLEVETSRARIPKRKGEDVRGRFIIRMDGLSLDDEVAELIPDDVDEDVRSILAGRELYSEDLELVAAKGGAVHLRGAVRFVVPEGHSAGDGPIGSLHFEPLSIRPDGDGALLAGRIRMDGFGLDPGVELRKMNGLVVIDRLRLGDDPQGAGRLVGVSGRVESVSVEGLEAPLLWQDGIFRIDPITGRAADGTLTAHLQLHTREPHGYEGQFKVDRFDVSKLKDDLAPTGPPISGVGTVDVAFQNIGGGVENATGAGYVRVRHGDLGELPGVANIFAFFAQLLDTQNQPSFDRLDINFTLQGEVFTLRRADLSGPLFDMNGTGTIDMNLIGDLRFTPHFITSMLLPGALQLPVIGDVLNAIVREQVLYDIRLRGDLTSVEPEIVAIPWTGIDFSDSFEGAGAQALPRRRVPAWFR